MHYAAMTRPVRHPTHFFVWQPLGQYVCDDIIEKNQAHRDKYEKWGQSFLTLFLQLALHATA